MNPDTIKVLIADDHPIFLRGLFDIIEESEGFHVVAEADDGEKALVAMRESHPDIAILDIAMPRMGGLDVLAKTGHWGEKPVFVLLTMFDDEIYLRKALEFGALGYLLKDNAEYELIACLHDILAGKRYISPGISGSPAGPSTAAHDPLECLTPTERKIFLLIADYKNNQEMADLLGVSIRTVQNHRANICQKLDLHGHNALFKLATQYRLSEAP